MENVSQNNNTMNNLKRNVGVSDTTMDSVSKLKSTLQEASSQAGVVARHVVADVKSVGSDSLSVCTEEGKKQLENIKSYAQSLEGYVKENPIKSVFVGLAAGAFLSKFLARSK